MSTTSGNRQMKNVLSICAILISTVAFATRPCDKCDIDKVKVVNEKLDSLTFDIVSEFLCTFDRSCSVNVEYSEWSNETLFRVLETDPALLLQVLATGVVDNTMILNEIQNPVVDLDLQGVYDNVKGISASLDMKVKCLEALVVAADKAGTRIEK